MCQLAAPREPSVGRVMLVCLLLLLGALVDAKVIEGQARVVDGDTLWIGRDKVRLYGIDAPEKGQECKDAKGATYYCGKTSTDALTQKIGNKPLRCEVKDVDQYGRNVAACSIKPASPTAKPEDIGTFLVSNGHATAYRAITKEYVPYEERAKQQRKGIWQGNFQNPSQWRKAKKAVDASEAAAAGGAAGQRPAAAAGRPQPPRPQQQQQQPATSSVGAGTGGKPSYAGVVGGR